MTRDEFLKQAHVEAILLEVIEISKEARAHFNDDEAFKAWWNKSIPRIYAEELLAIEKNLSELPKH
jgi:hypothetical protein